MRQDNNKGKERQMEKACRECEFCGMVKINSETDMGRCLRNPPTLMESFTQLCPMDLGSHTDKNAAAAVCSVWPVTDASDFCGEFVYKPTGDPQVTVIG
jgi:hypothetical protein